MMAKLLGRLGHRARRQAVDQEDPRVWRTEGYGLAPGTTLPDQAVIACATCGCVHVTHLAHLHRKALEAHRDHQYRIFDGTQVDAIWAYLRDEGGCDQAAAENEDFELAMGDD